MRPPTQSLSCAFALTLAGALTMVGGVSLLRARGLTSPLAGRKLMHITTGPVFILCWLLFPPSLLSPYLAAVVPFAVAMYMLANSRGLVNNAALIQTVSRSGRSEELAQGPLHYGLIHTFAAAWWWTWSPTGMVALLTLCVGDGLADMAGRRWGRTRWIWNRAKTVEGSLAFVLATVPVLFAFMSLFQGFRIYAFVPWSALQWQLPLVAVVAALVESLPFGGYDNIAVFAAIAAMGHALNW